MTPRLFWIPGPWRGRLAIAARPRGGDWLEDETKGWRMAGLDVVVSLLENEEAERLDLSLEGDLAISAGLRFISFPIPDRGVPSSLAACALCQQVAGELKDGQTVGVHCRQGIGRSGLIAIGALMASGVDASKAIEIASTARGLPVPETEGQCRWVRSLAEEQWILRPAPHVTLHN